MAAQYVRVEALVRVLGLPMALRLCAAVGGRRCYLPHPSRVAPHSEVAQVLGLALAQRLAVEWPMTHIEVPRGASVLRRQRDRLIHEQRATSSIADLARRFDLTERAVLQVLARPAPGAEPEAADERQLGLF